MTLRFESHGEPAYGGEGPSYGWSIAGLPQETLGRLRAILPQFGATHIHQGVVYAEGPFWGDVLGHLAPAIDAITQANGEQIPELEELRLAAKAELLCPTPEGICRLITPRMHALVGHSA